MKVLNFGSLNIDYVYSVDHFVREGETLLASKMETFCGGKGLNQSLALARAGIPVYHAGLIGEEGDLLLELCQKYGVNTDYIQKLPEKGGHTIIQVDKEGQNCILLYGGTNQMQTKESIDEVLRHFSSGDCLVLQNEINLLPYIIDRAYSRGMKIVLNPSPYDEKLDSCDLSKISLFILNEVEGEQFCGSSDPDQILERLAESCPNAAFVLTLGSKGAVWFDGNKKYFQDSFKTKTVDTTGAGDTFTGFFLASQLKGLDAAASLRIAAKAASIAVSRPGAAASIPTLEEVSNALQTPEQ